MGFPFIKGPRHWSLERDDNGFRTYTLRIRVITDSSLDGPATVLNTPGLPLPGAAWNLDNDFDTWVWCRPKCSVQPVVDDEPNTNWDVTFTFSNEFPIGRRGSDGSWRCHDQPLDDPLLMPPKISGSFVKYREEMTRDMFGQPIVNSAWELIRGPQVEFDRSRPTVRIEQNVLDLQLPLLYAMQDTVNAFELWGLPPRTVKFSTPNWSEQYYGQCYKYFTRSLEFDVNLKTHDKVLLDEGSKVLSGHWDPAGTGTWILDKVNGADPDPNNPRHFIRYRDFDENWTRVMLNGAGLPATSVVPTGNKFIALADNPVGQPGAPGSSGWAATSGVRGVYCLTTEYAAGDIVVTLNGAFMAATANVGQPPGAGPWTFLVNGFKDKGTWKNGETYKGGDMVGGTTALTQGLNYVRLYEEADFLLLGIPATIG